MPSYHAFINPVHPHKIYLHVTYFATYLFIQIFISRQQTIDEQWFVALFLCWILVFLLNREFEIGYRLSFYGNEVANQDKVRVQNMKNQADLLLHNIIPRFVAEELKNTSKYSKNHQDVGILFAS